MSPAQQVINFNSPTGKIIVNEGHKPEQSKDVVKPVSGSSPTWQIV